MEGRPADDSVLVARAVRGDARAYEEIVQRYQQVAFRTAYVITGSAADAEDAAQEGFVKAYRALDRFRPEAAIRPWLLRIVANEARNRARSTGRRRQLELKVIEDLRPGDAAPSPEAVAVGLDERRRLLAEVNALGEEDRQVIACRFFLQLSVERPRSRSASPAGRSSRGSRVRSGGFALASWRRQMPELEHRLLELGQTIAWPPTPRLRAVLPIYGEVAPKAPEWFRPRRARWILVAAAALLIIAAVAFAWIGVHTTIYRVPNPPTPAAHSPGVLGANLNLGTATTLAGAQARVKWPIRVPSRLGAPDAVYLKLPPDGPSQGEVTLVYAHAPGINASGQTGVTVLVTEARGSINETFFQKMIGPDATVEPVSAGGHSGYWISGHPHDFLFVGADGQIQQDTLRLATNTLILDAGGTIIRVEGDMTKAQALAIVGT